ncbi:transcriptional regulator with XRE-family HTH domain [Paenibacillus sp. W4I10]|uniref:helix-turn-helix domain-containing protein n=1 Tax=Paenibacillus sp. W4I10 TaxID=3042298 RepID=UPI002787B6B9|nr:helix-turn-helix transcriptional regulator [Paenibacillus sp. W4I10]MDQ0723534.1 transcriptional regulator with XRE-family HTH domain [Paenibacillus sp. W4I10]
MSELRQLTGTRIRAMRNAKGLTQQKLADIAGLDYRYIGALERGERNFSIDTLEKVLVALKVSISELMLFSEEDSESTRQKTIDEFILGINKLSEEQIKAILKINRELFQLII